ncbi:MAG: hypothetical protein IKS23_05450 [Alphaproteobacteria bacterium]|nr:hypothetical protein [Alphaproteobacteria bacterium]
MPEIIDQNGTTDILDATQNAVIDAVNSVSEMIEKTTAESTFSPQETAEPFYASAEFWVGVAFVLVVIFLSKPVSKAITTLLIKRREKIKARLNEAASLQDEAQKLLAQYERQYQNTQKEVEEIISKAEQELSDQNNKTTQLLENELIKKQKEAERIIETATDKARDEMTSAISKKTLEIVKSRLSENLTKSKRSKLIDASISNILKTL